MTNGEPQNKKTAAIDSDSSGFCVAKNLVTFVKRIWF
jgi:hypothetical protein